MGDLSIGILIGGAIVLLLQTKVKNRGPLDETDNHATGARSNMTVLIDHATGCQYLRGPNGGLTPRLDASGKPICRATAGEG